MLFTKSFIKLLGSVLVFLLCAIWNYIWHDEDLTFGQATSRPSILFHLVQGLEARKEPAQHRKQHHPK